MRKLWDWITGSRKRRRRLELDAVLVAELRRYFAEVEAVPPRGYDSMGDYFDDQLERYRQA